MATDPGSEQQTAAQGGEPMDGATTMAPILRAPTAEEQERKRACGLQAEQDRASLVFEFPFLAQLALHLDLVPVIDCRLPTAATDGRTIWLNPDFLATLSDGERLFVLGHEVWHCALGHIGRRGPREPERWNAAIDHEVNVMLVAEGLKMPEDAVLFPGWKGQPAEEVYELLDPERFVRPQKEEEEEEEDGEDREGNGDGEDDGEEDEDFDDSLDNDDAYWDYYRKMQPKVAPRGPRADVHEPGLELPARPELVLDPDYAPAFEPLPDDVWKERLVAAAQRVPNAGHNLGEALRIHLAPLVAPTVPWQEVLRRFVTSAYGGERRWLPPNRRYISRGLYLPSRRTERLRVLVAVDTSGSTIGALPQFATELVALVDSFGDYELTVLFCDEEIRAVERYDRDRPLVPEELPFVGGCGTDLRPPFDWYEREAPDVNVLLYLTDGFGDAPEAEPRIPTLWVLTSDGEPPAPWGEVCWLGEIEGQDGFPGWPLGGLADEDLFD